MLAAVRTFVIGDIHGAYKALIQCLEKAQFSYAKDKLICLGDVCDGWPEVDKCFDVLLRIKRLVLLMGNHDELALKWASSNIKSKMWRADGGKGTMDSYPDGMAQEHIELLGKARTYFEYKDRLFVHGGFDPRKPIHKQPFEYLLWNRSLVEAAVNKKNSGDATPLSKYKEVYVGHTPTLRFGKKKPINACEVWLMDTGAGWNGRLSLMNIETKELFQSKSAKKLYPYYTGRY